MYCHTHHGMQRIEWPNGGCYFDQLQLTVDVFDMIRAELKLFKEQQ